MSTAAIKRYWNHVAAMGCIICGGPAEICHAIGKPSVTERIHEPKPKGKKLLRHSWLVVPACPYHHRLTRFSLDYDPQHFEEMHGPVAKHIDRISKQLGIDVWKLSQEGRKI